MSNYNFNYAFNISGNCNAVVAEISGGVENLQRNLQKTTSMWDTFEGKILALNQFTQYVNNLGQALNGTFAPGAALNTKLAELEAIAGPTAEELALVEKCARNTAKEFGVSAAGAVESYKLLLSQLSPELTKNGEALNHMGENVATLSKMMGNDATAAAEVLTTAMNQYGVSLDDPLAASDRMWEMMNTMAAAAREGSAELPQISEALKQCGMAAKAAGVSFEETNAAIQVLDKAGKKASEGGVALRNVMSTLAQGRFLPKDVREELTAAGVNINDLTDKSKTLTERLAVLKPVMADDALFSKLFGKENSAAAMALVQGIPKVEQWTEAITGTTTAIDQSQIVMETYNERLARVQARFDDFKISIFNCCGDMGIWVQVIMGALVPLSQLVPLIYGAGKAIIFLKNANFAGALAGVVSKIRNIIIGLTMMNTSITVSGGYWVAFKLLAQNVCRSIGVAIMNIPIVGWIAAAIAAVIAIIQQLWDKCYGFRVAVFTAWEAIKAIFNAAWELISSIARSIANFAMSVWNTITSIVNKVVSVVVTVYNKVKSFIMSIVNFIAKGVSACVGFIKKICQPVVDAFNWVVRTVGGFFSNLWAGIKNVFIDSINWLIDQVNKIIKYLPGVDYIKKLGRAAADASWAADHPNSKGGGGGSETPPVDDSPITPEINGGASPIGNALGGVGGKASKETDRVKNINITIDKLIDKFTISTTNLSESKERIKDAVAEALLSAVNDANYAL